MTLLPPELLRPANLSEVRAPGLLLRVGKYGQPFLIVGTETDPDVIALEGEHRFHSFKRSAAENWSGLAIEDVQFEIDFAFAIDVSGCGRAPGTIVRKGRVLSIAAISSGSFRQTIEIPIKGDLPESSPNEQVAFYAWRAFVMVGDERRTVWECALPLERDW